MDRLFRSFSFILMLAFTTAGCAGLKARPCPCVTGAKAEEAQQKAPELSERRLMLSEGYSMLYRDASNLNLSELILYFKVESDAVDEVVTALSEFGNALKENLERIAKDYPGVRIDLDPLPEMEKRKRAALSNDRARYFAPIIGKGGREYERTVLIGLSNAINHERYLAQVMAEEEPDEGLKKFLLSTKRGYDALYNRTAALLDTEYFTDPNGPSKD